MAEFKYSDIMSSLRNIYQYTDENKRFLGIPNIFGQRKNPFTHGIRPTEGPHSQGLTPYTPGSRPLVPGRGHGAFPELNPRITTRPFERGYTTLPGRGPFNSPYSRQPHLGPMARNIPGGMNPYQTFPEGGEVGAATGAGAAAVVTPPVVVLPFEDRWSNAMKKVSKEYGIPVDKLQEYIDALKPMENPQVDGKHGWDSKTNTWKPHAAPEAGGGQDIAWGLKKANFTDTEWANIVKDGLSAEDADLKLLSVLEKKIKTTQTYVDSKDKKAWTNMPGEYKLLLTDYEYNVKGGVKAYPKFTQAVIDNDYKTAKAEYERSYTKEVKVPVKKIVDGEEVTVMETKKKVVPVKNRNQFSNTVLESDSSVVKNTLYEDTAAVEEYNAAIEEGNLEVDADSTIGKHINTMLETLKVGTKVDTSDWDWDNLTEEQKAQVHMPEGEGADVIAKKEEGEPILGHREPVGETYVKPETKKGSFADIKKQEQISKIPVIQPQPIPYERPEHPLRHATTPYQPTPTETEQQLQSEQVLEAPKPWDKRFKSSMDFVRAKMAYHKQLEAQQSQQQTASFAAGGKPSVHNPEAIPYGHLPARDEGWGHLAIGEFYDSSGTENIEGRSSMDSYSAYLQNLENRYGPAASSGGRKFTGAPSVERGHIFRGRNPYFT